MGEQSQPAEAVRRKFNRILEVFAAVQSERKYQDGKWGPFEQQNGRDLPSWFNTIREELEEAANAYYKAPRDGDLNVFLELVQVAAVAFAALEQLAPDNLDELTRKHRGLPERK